MKKYYIPTSTLNFGNIMSSESISPKSFYAQRGFGYSRWLSIPENCNDNVVILYSDAFKFQRPKSDAEDHPMLIEIETDDNFNSIAKGVYYCDHTLYLSPWHTRFFFFAEHDMNFALSLSEIGAEDKMLRLYKKRISVMSQLDMKNIPLGNNEFKLNETSIKNDQRINKMKGLIYGYYIGALLSTTPENVDTHNVLRELQNVFSAVLSSNDHIVLDFQEKEIRKLIAKIHFSDPIIEEIKKWVDEPKMEDLLNCLMRNGFSHPKIKSADSLLSDLAEVSDNPSTHPSNIWIRSQKKLLKNKVEKERKLLCPRDNSIVIDDLSVAKIAIDILNNDLEKKVAISWVNNVLSSNKYNSHISSFKRVLADDVTDKAKEILGTQWIGSDIQKVLNNMRKYINGNENEFKWDNLLISSIAAVIAKGNEWEELLSFMQSKNICDYRLAFAFYGELNGFANLTRDFTDLLLNENNRYVAAVYKEFSGQLLGIDPIGMETSLLENRIEHSQQKQKNVINGNPTFRNGILTAFEQLHINKTRQQDFRSSLNDALSANGNNMNYDWFFAQLKTYPYWKGKKRVSKYWNKLRGMFCKEKPSNKITKTPQKQDNQPSLGLSFEEESNVTDSYSKRASMFEDRTWWNKTADMISDTKVRRQYLTDVEWFIENHKEFYNDKKKGQTNGYYYNHPIDNARLLERFRVYLQNKLKPNPRAPWIATEYKKVPIGHIIEYLTSLYGDR